MNTPSSGGEPAFPHGEILHEGTHGTSWPIPAQPGMTLRAYAAIHLNVPESGIDWLDAMIAKANRDRFAGKALAELCANPSASNQEGWTCEVVAGAAYEAADAMIEMERQ